MKKLDIFPHIFPKRYFDKMVEIVPNKDAIRRWTNKIGRASCRERV